MNYSALKRLVYRDIRSLGGSQRLSATGGATPPNEQVADPERGGLGWAQYTPPMSPGSPQRSDLSAPLLYTSLSGSLDPDVRWFC